jgi:hypothetical protein
MHDMPRVVFRFVPPESHCFAVQYAAKKDNTLRTLIPKTVFRREACIACASFCAYDILGGDGGLL